MKTRAGTDLVVPEGWTLLNGDANRLRAYLLRQRNAGHGRSADWVVVFVEPSPYIQDQRRAVYVVGDDIVTINDADVSEELRDDLPALCRYVEALWRMG